MDWKSDIQLQPIVIQGFLKKSRCNFVHQTIHFIFLIQMFVHNLHLHIVLQNWSRVTMIHTTLLKHWVTSEKKLTTFQTDLFISTDLFVFSLVKHRDNFILHQKSLQALFWAPAEPLNILNVSYSWSYLHSTHTHTKKIMKMCFHKPLSQLQEITINKEYNVKKSSIYFGSALQHWAYGNKISPFPNIHHWFFIGSNLNYTLNKTWEKEIYCFNKT